MVIISDLAIIIDDDDQDRVLFLWWFKRLTCVMRNNLNAVWQLQQWCSFRMITALLVMNTRVFRRYLQPA